MASYVSTSRRTLSVLSRSDVTSVPRQSTSWKPRVQAIHYRARRVLIGHLQTMKPCGPKSDREASIVRNSVATDNEICFRPTCSKLITQQAYTAAFLQFGKLEMNKATTLCAPREKGCQTVVEFGSQVFRTLPETYT
jgi:hypothetical protein